MNRQEGCPFGRSIGADIFFSIWFVTGSFSRDIGRWPENQMAAFYWTSFQCPGAILTNMGGGDEKSTATHEKSKGSCEKKENKRAWLVPCALSADSTIQGRSVRTDEQRIRYSGVIRFALGLLMLSPLLWRGTTVVVGDRLARGEIEFSDAQLLPSWTEAPQPV